MIKPANAKLSFNFWVYINTRFNLVLEMLYISLSAQYQHLIIHHQDMAILVGKCNAAGLCQPDNAHLLSHTILS